jgi:hypothetical protein
LARVLAEKDVRRERWWVTERLSPVGGYRFDRSDLNSDELGRAILAWERESVDDL